MEIEERAKYLESLEAKSEAVIQEKIKVLSICMKAPFAFSKVTDDMVEVGKRVIPKDLDWGLRSWIMFLRTYRGPAFGRVLASAGIEDKKERNSLNTFDFSLSRWHQVVSAAAGVDIFHEARQHSTHDDFERVYLGVNLTWKKDDEIREFASYTRLVVPSPEGWSKDTFQPEALIIDSGEGFSKEFPVEGFPVEEFPIEELENKSTQRAIEDAILKAYFRANQSDPGEYWRLRFDKLCVGIETHDVTARRAVEKGKLLAAITPTYIPVPVLAQSELSLIMQMGQMQTLSRLSGGVDRLLQAHGLSSWGVGR